MAVVVEPVVVEALDLDAVVELERPRQAAQRASSASRRTTRRPPRASVIAALRPREPSADDRDVEVLGHSAPS